MNKLTRYIAMAACSAVVLSSCAVYDYPLYTSGSVTVGGPHVSTSVSWSNASYDANGFPIFGYYYGRPVYGYTAAGAAVFSFAALTAACLVPNWGPASWYSGHWHYPPHVHRVAVPPHCPPGHYPGVRPPHHHHSSPAPGPVHHSHSAPGPVHHSSAPHKPAAGPHHNTHAPRPGVQHKPAAGHKPAVNARPKPAASRPAARPVQQKVQRPGGNMQRPAMNQSRPSVNRPSVQPRTSGNFQRPSGGNRPSGGHARPSGGNRSHGGGHRR